MIIVGAYPDHVFTNSAKNNIPSLVNLRNAINCILPSEISIHILPFYFSCGDGGFAISDWNSIDCQFGDWTKIKEIANERNVIIDGVFNHVGVEHEFVKLLKASPEKHSDLFHVNPCVEMDSPRGIDANCEFETVNGNIIVRKTHSKSAIDINLESTEIQKHIKEFLRMISNYGIFGVRLDAVAYYKKGSKIRHNEGSYDLANRIVDIAKNAGMRVFAQIDADADGKKYFKEKDYNDVAIYDFGYSAALSLSIIEKTPCELATFLQINSDENRPLIRAPRTHDGILLRSGNLKKNQVEKIISWANYLDVPVRKANDIPYELNCSLPFLIKSVCPEYFEKMLETTIILTGILNSIPYFYLPYLVGFIPEEQDKPFALPSRFESDDPRTLNRIPFSSDHIHKSNFVRLRTFRVLEILTTIHKVYEAELIYGSSDISTVDNKLLRVITAKGAIDGVFNFSQFEVRNPLCYNQNEYISYKSRAHDTMYIEPGGYSVLVKNKSMERR